MKDTTSEDVLIRTGTVSGDSFIRHRILYQTNSLPQCFPMFLDGFKTTRLVLRPVEKGDAEAIFAGYATDPVVSRYQTWRPHCRLSDTHAYIAHCMEASSSRTYAVIERKAGHLIGVFEVRRPNAHCIGFGYALAHQWWDKGLMTEALSEVASWSLQQPSVWRVADVCDVDNRASARVMEKAGLEREGILRRWAVHPNLGPEPRDCVSYARVRSSG